MLISNRRARIGAGIALAASAALLLSACSGSASADPTGSAGTGAKASTATSLKDFGTLADLQKAAETEGKLNLIALPHDWANYGEIIDAFKKKYPKIAINEASPDASSAEEIQAAKTNDGLDTAPDVFDLGLTVTLQNTDKFAAYKVSTWDDIPENLKDKTGLFTGDYGGFMSIGYDSSKFPEPKKLDDLKKSEFKGSLALNGGTVSITGTGTPKIGSLTVAGRNLDLHHNRMVLTNTGGTARPYEISIMGETGNTIGTANLTGTVPANGTKVVDLNTVMTSFTGKARGTVNVTVAAPNNQIQGLLQIVSDAGAISNHVMVRPGTN